jgi:DNA (cytosine-5)-methyltransferase 1
VDEPSSTLTEKARSWVREPMIVSTGLAWEPDGTCQEFDAATEPARTVTATTGGQWWLNPGVTDSQPNRRRHKVDAEPAPTVAFGHDAAGWQWEAIRITIRDALILQSFRPDYPVAGNKTKQFEQIGNAICPRLAYHILRQLIGDPNGPLPESFR